MALFLDGCGRSGVWMCGEILSRSRTRIWEWVYQSNVSSSRGRGYASRNGLHNNEGRIPLTRFFPTGKRKSRDVRSEQGFGKCGGHNLRGWDVVLVQGS